MKVLLASPRGFCAGVNMAIESLDLALASLEPPIYVYHEIVHNKYVVDTFRAKGAVFVDDLADVPPEATLLFSAHGVSPEIRRIARERRLRAIDATCPLVTKVHIEAVRFAREGYAILLIGHEGHDETIGTMGEAPDHIRVVGTKEEAETVQVPDPEHVSYLTQTTLSLDDTAEIVAVLKRRFPKLVQPHKDDICYATQNRQNAVKMMVPHMDMLLVLGAPNSSNSVRLREVAESKGAKSHLIERATDIRPEWLHGVKRLGLTASASAPEILVQEVVDRCKKEFGVRNVEEFETVEEDIVFSLPYELEQLIKKGKP